MEYCLANIDHREFMERRRAGVAENLRTIFGQNNHRGVMRGGKMGG